MPFWGAFFYTTKEDNLYDGTKLIANYIFTTVSYLSLILKMPE